MFKVGDKVVFNGGYGPDLTKGKTYDVINRSDNSVCVRDDVNDDNWCCNGDFTLVDENTQELQELRAFKAAALVRFPQLTLPETDEEAANRLGSEFYNTDEDAKQFALRVIQWVRAR